MTKALYMDNSYLIEFEATVISIKDDKFVVLDQTAFYAQGGGQPCDTGIIKRNGEEFKVLFVSKFEGDISHEVDKAGLNIGDKVSGKIDWARRYSLMKSHTVAHIISGILNKETGALISGNQLKEGQIRIDFDLEAFNKDEFQKYIDLTNNAIQQKLEVKTYYLKREEAMKIPGIVKLAGALPPSIDTLRLVEIGDVDLSADGGTHVNNTCEIGVVSFLKYESKGKNNRRVYLEIK